MIKDSFLSKVAIDVSEKYNHDFSNLNIIFTNKRAKIFFNEALYDYLQKPFFSPHYYTINDFVSKYSSLVQAEELILVYYLFEVYSEVFYRDKPNVARETFEQFYYWGIMLLKDFDDIDKHLASADHIFNTIEDYRELEDKFDYLTQEQKEVLNSFFEGCFRNDVSSEIKNRFISIWNCLLEIYDIYKQRLKGLGIGYSGMLYRDLVEKLKGFEKIGDRSYCIVGFNVLNNVEKEIFSWLKSTYDTHFYWDYDDFYVNSSRQEAGLFLRENLKLFPMPQDYIIDTNLIEKNNQVLEIIASPNENSQVGYISKWLNNLVKENDDIEQSDIAIILCNEDLLPSVLCALPEKIGEEKTKVNITMGYKFQATSMFALIDHYLNFQASLTKNKTLRLKNLLPFVEHNYFKGEYKRIIEELVDNNAVSLSNEEIESFGGITDLLDHKSNPLALISALQDIVKIVVLNNISTDKGRKGHKGIEEVLAETIFRLSNNLNNLQDLFENDKIDVRGNLLYQTIRSQLSNIIIPFEGDPINGIQIMGLLETRNLDFKHILFLSTNDDVLPNVSMDSSFIPFSIRKAYSLTTIERKIAVFAYYFYRLFQHSKSMHFLYNSTSTDVKPKEMSRFLQQLRIETNKSFSYSTFISNISSYKEKIININRQKVFIDKIVDKSITNYLSPTYINDYLNCGLKFFLKHIISLEKIGEFKEDLQENDFGTIFHDSAKDFYNKIIKEKLEKGDKEKDARMITSSDIIDNKRNIEDIVKFNFEKVYLKKTKRSNPKIEYNQLNQIKLQILNKYLHKLIELDINYSPFTIIAMEKKIIKIIDIDGKNIKIGGYIDRIDYKINEKGKGVIRVLDYKTNNSPKENVRLDQVFFIDDEIEPMKRNDYFFQAFLYCWLISENKKFKDLLFDIKYDIIKPEILYIKKASSNDYSSDIELKSESKGNIKVENFFEIEKYFEENLKYCVQNMLIYEDNTIFQQRKIDCEYCDFNTICY